MRIRGAPDVGQQARVVGVRGRRAIDTEPVAEPHRDQRGLEPVIEREAHPEVGGQAQRCDQLRAPPSPRRPWRTCPRMPTESSSTPSGWACPPGEGGVRGALAGGGRVDDRPRRRRQRGPHGARGSRPADRGRRRRRGQPRGRRRAGGPSRRRGRARPRGAARAAGSRHACGHGLLGGERRAAEPAIGRDAVRGARRLRAASDDAGVPALLLDAGRQFPARHGRVPVDTLGFLVPIDDLSAREALRAGQLRGHGRGSPTPSRTATPSSTSAASSCRAPSRRPSTEVSPPACRRRPRP